MKKIKKILASLVLTFSLVSCELGNNEQQNIEKQFEFETYSDDCSSYSSIGGKYLCYLKTYTPHEKDQTKTVDNEEFNKYLDDIFYDAISDNYLYMHFQVTNYKAFGIEKPEVSFGKPVYGEDNYTEYIDEINELKQFDYDSLSYKQEYYYDMYLYSLYETVLSNYYGKYSLLFSQNVDTLSNMITNLINFKLYDKESVDDFILLLDDFDNYFDACLLYTEEQAKTGLYHTDESIDYVIEYIDTFTSAQENAITKAFKSAVEEVDFLSLTEVINYETKVAELVEDVVLPTCMKIAVELNKYKGKTTSLDNALCRIDKDYAEAQYLLASSSNKPIDQQYEQLLAYYKKMLEDFITSLYIKKADVKYEELMDDITNKIGTSYVDYLEYLKKNLTKSYPELIDVQYDVEAMDASTSVGTTLAYYMQSPLDDLNSNIIRVNEQNLSEDPVQALSTLAHEGFPGHLYQHVYYLNTNPHKFVYTQAFGGYTEGYAVRAQVDILDTYIDDDDLFDYTLFNNIYYFLAYSIMDIAINYYGYDSDKLKELLNNELMLNGEMASEMLDFFLDVPTVYCSYGCGYVEFTILRDNANIDLGKEFDLVEFNKAILTHGELPFVLVNQAIDEYIESK